MELIQPQKNDRIFYTGRMTKDYVGSLRAHYGLGLLLYEIDDSLTSYSVAVKGILEYINTVYPTPKSVKALYANEHRIYTPVRNRMTKEYGYHYTADGLSLYVKVNQFAEFVIFVYKEDNNGEKKH